MIPWGCPMALRCYATMPLVSVTEKVEKERERERERQRDRERQTEIIRRQFDFDY